jgi:hypothetical protein
MIEGLYRVTCYEYQGQRQAGSIGLEQLGGKGCTMDVGVTTGYYV